MPRPFRGTVNLDIRDSVPDWGPYEQPKAAPGSPNIVYIVLDDVGFGALSCYGGPVQTPNIDRIAAGGLRYGQFHTTALCSPTRSCLLTGRNDVWEWTTDLFRPNHASPTPPTCCAPGGPHPDGDRFARRVTKGGSHLCAANYCLRYRPAARQGQTEDTATCHMGFRCVVRA